MYTIYSHHLAKLSHSLWHHQLDIKLLHLASTDPLGNQACWSQIAGALAIVCHCNALKSQGCMCQAYKQCMVG